jgi:hypothetical protein
VLSHPLTKLLSLATLPLHIHEVLLSLLFYTLLQLRFSPALSTYLFPVTYPSLSADMRLKWNVRVVSFVQSVFICTLAFYVLYAERDLRRDLDWRGRIFGYTGAGGLVQACAMGYFLWDIGVSVFNVKVLGMQDVLHGVAAGGVTLMGFVSIILVSLLPSICLSRGLG